MRGVKVGNGTAVRYHNISETPFVTQNPLQQTGAAAAGLVIYPLIGTHNLTHIGFPDQGLESGQVGFMQLARIQRIQIELVAAPFGSRMHGKMFRTGQQFTVFGIGRALQSFYHLDAHT